ncbi:MAG: hypothetical protein ABIQ16_18600 [Polyangiaceae bacterium]
MTPRFTSALIFTLASSAALLAAPAYAADANADAPKSDSPDAPDPDAPGSPTPAADDAAATGEKEKAPNPDSSLIADAEAGSSPVELPGKTYYAVGLRYRAIIVPKFMINLFGDGGKTVIVHGIGPEFTIRKNAFEYNLSTWFASYALDPTPFKGKSDGADAWELVQSKIKILYLTADFMWSQDLAPEFAFNYGVGAGFGFVWGDLIRDQATRGPNANDSTGEGYVKCPSGNGQGFCLPEKHYGYNEPSWASGGSKPLIFPWLTLQTGLRWKPHRNFIGRLDAGFGTSGFFLGLGADYGL